MPAGVNLPPVICEFLFVSAVPGGLIIPHRSLVVSAVPDCISNNIISSISSELTGESSLPHGHVISERLSEFNAKIYCAGSGVRRRKLLQMHNYRRLQMYTRGT